jgi:DNA-binding HxlR family transcriptional regulator
MRKAVRTAEPTPCAIGQALRIFDGRWKGAIIWLLEGGPRRFNELRRLMPEVTPRALTLQLRDLERDGLVRREHFKEIPPRVEYSRTELCETLVPVLDSIVSWWARSGARVARARKAFEARTNA